MWVKLINMLPSRLAVFVICRLLDYATFRRKFWIKYYLNKLQKTKDYYKTLSALNSNKFVPSTLYLQFIEEAHNFGSICRNV